MTARLAATGAVLAALAVCAPASASVSYIGGVGTAPGKFSYPTSIALDASGRLIVADSGNARVQTLTSEGVPVASFDTPDAAAIDYPTVNLALGKDGDIFVNRMYTGWQVLRYSAAGADEGTVGPSYSYEPGYYSGARGVATDRDGNIYVLTQRIGAAGDRVIKFSPDGTYVTEWPVLDATNAGVAGRGIAGSDGVVAVLTDAAPSAAEVIRYDGSGQTLSRWSAGTDSVPYAAGALAIALEPGGDVLLAAGSRIRELTPAGALEARYDADPNEGYHYSSNSNPCVPVRTLASTDSSTLPYFSSLAADPQGNVYATDTVNNRIVKLDPKPVVHVEWAPQPTFAVKSPLTGQTVTFDASRSSAPLDRMMKFEWDLDGNGSFETDTGSSPRATSRYATEGPRTLKLRITNSRGESTEATIALQVNPSTATIVSMRPSLTGQKVTFDATRSTLPCGSVLKYEWDLDGDGTFETDTGTSPLVEKTYSEPTRILVKVRVTRAGGRVDEGTRLQGIRLAPPPGEAGVTINDGAVFTNDSLVHVNPTWLPWTRRMTVSNDGGFGHSKTFVIGPSQFWRLDSSGAERLPKTIYVRYDVAKDRTFTDDIILDEIKPLVTDAEIVAGDPSLHASTAGRHVLRVRIKARDNLSGVAKMQIASKRRHPGKWLRARRRARVRASGHTVWVRVRDRAGNRSGWRLAR